MSENFSPRILCVDDDEDTCEMMNVLLKLEGIRCVSASDAFEARRLMENEQFDLYVVDANLPDVSGLQLCREIRVRDRTTPIVMFSAAAYDKDQEEGLRAGASKYVVKPAIERVLSTIHQLLRERAMRR